MTDPDNPLARLAEAAAEASGADVVMLLVADEPEAALRSVGHYGLYPNGDSEIVFPMCGFHEVALAGPESTDEGLAGLPVALARLLDREGIQAITRVPLPAQPGVTGVLLLGTRERGRAPQPSDLIRALADVAAATIKRLRLLDGASQELHELRTLARITDKIRLEESREQVVVSVLEAGAEALEADATVLYLLDAEQRQLTCEAAIGLPVEAVEPKSDRQRMAICDALERSDPLIISDMQSLAPSDPFRQMILDVGVRSVLGLQLRHRGLPMGLLAALYRRPNASADPRAETCQVLASDAAVALNYSRLLEQWRSLARELEAANARLERQAVQDGLTGLANHRAIHQRLSEQVQRVGRYGEVFSLAMIDVDHFKAYNDAYGHQEGDLALQQLAKIMSGTLRECDLPGRYGGEEFAIIFPHTPKARARIALEHIRRAVDSFEFPNGKLTVSAGLAEAPADGVTANELLEKADRALYHAKLTGRNRVCLWAAPQEQSGGSEPVGTRTVSVLVVEDDKDARRAMEEVLHGPGYELHRASSSKEAIDLLRTRKFDIMLSDTLILGTDGMEVIGLASEIHPAMPIVLTTAPSMAGMAREAMRHGVTDLLVKPFSEHELPVVIERNLERKRLERQMLLQKSTGILLQAIDALVTAIDAKDRLTAGHTTRVTHLSLAVADTLGLPSEERYTLELAARLHDIGKLSLPDSALNKPGPLSEEEWAAMRRHPAVGSQIVGAIEELSYVATIVRHHHERLDGRGYPDGLQGEAIPLLARIIAVADAFEAMTNDRSFRSKMTTEEAIAELRRCTGTHYSADVVEALIKALSSGALDEYGQEQAA